MQTEVTTVSKDLTEEKEDKNQKEEVVKQDLITVDVKVRSNHLEFMICQLEVVSTMLSKSWWLDR